MRKVLVLFIIAMLLPFTAGCGKTKESPLALGTANSEHIMAAGSGSNLPLTRKILEAFNLKNGTNLIIPGSIGSGGAIKAVADGVLQLGLTSRPLTEAEKQNGLQQQRYARIGIIIGVHPDVPDTAINYQDLVDILTGAKNSWQNGQRIVVFIREAGDSSMSVLGKEIPGFAEAWSGALAHDRWQVMYTDGDEGRAVQATSSSLGFTDTGSYITEKLIIKPLQVNGVEPTLENIKNGSYQLYKDLYLVFRAPLTERAAEFKDFIFSEAGNRIIIENGGLPLKGE